jgi:hypothetical protein
MANVALVLELFTTNGEIIIKSIVRLANASSAFWSEALGLARRAVNI